MKSPKVDKAKSWNTVIYIFGACNASPAGGRGSQIYMAKSNQKKLLKKGRQEISDSIQCHCVGGSKCSMDKSCYRAPSGVRTQFCPAHGAAGVAWPILEHSTHHRLKAIHNQHTTL
eukprot:4455659-Amphidinium_carterae.1